MKRASSLPADPNTSWFNHLLWIDCTAGAIVGIAVLALHGWLSQLYGLPENVLLFTGVANVLYASYSFSLARREKRSRPSVYLLVVANMAWAPVCLVLAFLFRSTASFFGMGHLILEALFVGGLGLLEWRWRGLLITS